MGTRWRASHVVLMTLAVLCDSQRAPNLSFNLDHQTRTLKQQNVPFGGGDQFRRPTIRRPLPRLPAELSVSDVRGRPEHNRNQNTPTFSRFAQTAAAPQAQGQFTPRPFQKFQNPTPPSATQALPKQTFQKIQVSNPHEIQRPLPQQTPHSFQQSRLPPQQSEEFAQQKQPHFVIQLGDENIKASQQALTFPSVQQPRPPEPHHRFQGVQPSSQQLPSFPRKPQPQQALRILQSQNRFAEVQQPTQQTFPVLPTPPQLPQPPPVQQVNVFQEEQHLTRRPPQPPQTQQFSQNVIQQTQTSRIQHPPQQVFQAPQPPQTQQFSQNVIQQTQTSRIQHPPQQVFQAPQPPQTQQFSQNVIQQTQDQTQQTFPVLPPSPQLTQPPQKTQQAKHFTRHRPQQVIQTPKPPQIPQFQGAQHLIQHETQQAPSVEQRPPQQVIQVTHPPQINQFQRSQNIFQETRQREQEPSTVQRPPQQVFQVTQPPQFPRTPQERAQPQQPLPTLPPLPKLPNPPEIQPRPQNEFQDEIRETEDVSGPARPLQVLQFQRSQNEFQEARQPLETSTQPQNVFQVPEQQVLTKPQTNRRFKAGRRLNQPRRSQQGQEQRGFQRQQPRPFQLSSQELPATEPKKIIRVVANPQRSRISEQLQHRISQPKQLDSRQFAFQQQQSEERQVDQQLSQPRSQVQAFPATTQPDFTDEQDEAAQIKHRFLLQRQQQSDGRKRQRVPPQTSISEQEEPSSEEGEADNAMYSFSSSVKDTIHDNQVTREETRDGKKVSGSYSYSDGFVRRTVHYEADEKGYRIIKQETEPIGEGPVEDIDGKAEITSNVGGNNLVYSITADDVPLLAKLRDEP